MGNCRSDRRRSQNVDEEVEKMEYGHFAEGGRKYEIVTPHTLASWKNILYNDTYYLEMDQTLQGSGIR